jgi:hypothetical protein
VDSQLNDLDAEEDRFVINKEMYHAAFFREMLEIYRSHSSLLGDLDTNYLRVLKKVDNRK